MTTKRVLILVSILMAAFLGYVAGSKIGPERARQRSDAQFRISVGLSHYQFLKDGEIERVQGRIGFLLWSEMREYERKYGVPSGADPFVRKFTAAKIIAEQNKPTMVDLGTVLATSLPPDIKLEIK